MKKVPKWSIIYVTCITNINTESEIVEIVMFQGLNGSNPKSFGSKTVSLSKWGRESLLLRLFNSL